MRYTIQNEMIECEIDSHGAELKSLLRKSDGKQIMWGADPAYWNRTSPVLFPFVGGVKDKEYRYDGKTYTIGQHGFARDMEFTLDSLSDDEIWFSLSESEESLEKYPFGFLLQIGYRLEESSVRVMWEVQNTNDGDMWFSIGAHPAFLCPVHGFNKDKAACKEGYKLYFEGTDVIWHHGNDVAKGLALRENIEMPLENGFVTITSDFFDRCTYMIEGNQTKCVGIADEEGKHIVDVCFDTPLFAIWSPEKKNGMSPP